MSTNDLRPPSDDPLGDDPVAEYALRCPLCGYDLRGLDDERCPECGHPYDRATLRQVHDERQQWFFEHARRRLLVAFMQTMWASLFPRRFWSRVRAGHVIAPGRLRAWAAIASLLVVLMLLAASAGRLMTPRPGDQSFLMTSTALRESAQRFLASGVPGPAAAMLAIAFAWPVLTVAAMSVFGRSLDRRGVRPAHLRRVALYAWPTALLPIVAAVVAGVRVGTPETLLDLPPSTLSIVIGLPLSWLLVLAIVIAGTTWHLIVAHARYLRVRHAAAQALLVQAVVWLALAAALLVPRLLF